MRNHRIITSLQALAEARKLSAFAAAAMLDRRTLQRIVSGAGVAYQATLTVIELELRKPRWKAVIAVRSREPEESEES